MEVLEIRVNGFTPQKVILWKGWRMYWIQSADYEITTEHTIDGLSLSMYSWVDINKFLTICVVCYVHIEEFRIFVTKAAGHSFSSGRIINIMWTKNVRWDPTSPWEQSPFESTKHTKHCNSCINVVCKNWSPFLQWHRQVLALSGEEEEDTGLADEGEVCE